MAYFNHLVRYKSTGQFQISTRRESRQKHVQVVRIRFLKINFSKNFVLSDAEDKVPELLRRGGIALLPLLRTLSTVCKN